MSTQPWDMPWRAGGDLGLKKLLIRRFIPLRRETQKDFLGEWEGLEDVGCGAEGQEALISKPSNLVTLSHSISISSSLKMKLTSGAFHAVVGFRTTCLKIPSTRQITLHCISKNSFGSRDVLFCTWILRCGERVKTALRILFLKRLSSLSALEGPWLSLIIEPCLHHLTLKSWEWPCCMIQ